LYNSDLGLGEYICKGHVDLSILDFFLEFCKFIFKIGAAVTSNDTTVIKMWHDKCIIKESGNNRATSA